MNINYKSNEKTPLLSDSFDTEIISLLPDNSVKMTASKIKKILTDDESDFSESEIGGKKKDDGLEDDSVNKDEEEESDEDKIMNAETKLKIQEVDPGNLSQKDERHTFKCVIRNLVLRETQDISSSPIRLKFIIGGHPPTDNRHLGGKIEKGKNGPKFTTGFRKGEGEWRNEEYIKYWKGSYRDLEKEKLQIFLYKKQRCRGDELVAEAAISLKNIVNGCVQQEITLEKHAKGKHRILGTLSYVVYFQELCTFKLRFYDWQANNLKPRQGSSTLDPYLVLAIDRDWTKFFRTGGYFFRNATSTIEQSTLFPRWDRDPIILYYYGIKSELENEELLIKVLDFDKIQSDSLVGSAKVPLKGFLDYGYIDSALSVEEEVEGNENQVRIVEAGKIEGYVTIDNLPPHNQWGDVVNFLPGYQYLAIRIESLSNLKPTKPTGWCDCFVSVEWAGQVQKTKVVKNNNNPIINDVLYFPLRLIAITSESLEKKGPVKINVFDYDDRGNSFLGTVTFTLDNVTNAGVINEGEIKTRVYTESSRLFLQGERTGSSISFTSFFRPDIPEDIKISKKKDRQKNKLPMEIAKRRQQWKSEIPERIIENNQLKIHRIDEDGTPHVLPSYLCKLVPPSDMHNSKVLLRMVHCFPWINDAEVLEDKAKASICVSTNFFLDIKKGATLEHALLLTNLFLGMSLDAYLCIGKTIYGKDHAWVMTRNKKGSITFWETSTCKFYELEERWKGIEEEIKEDEDEETEKGNKKDEKIEKNEDLISFVTEEALKEENLMFYDDDEFLPSNFSFFSQLEQDIQLEGSKDDKSSLVSFTPSLDGGVGVILEKEDDKVDKLPYKSLEMIVSPTNIYANLQSFDPNLCKYDFEYLNHWSSFVGNSQINIPPCFFNVRKLGPRLPTSRVIEIRQDIIEEVQAGITNWRHGEHMDTTFNKSLSSVLESGLVLMEKERILNSKLSKEISNWKGQVTAASPKGYDFEGLPFNFVYTDSRKIRKYILQNIDFHTVRSEDIMFSVAALMVPYYNGCVSVWVFVAKLIKI